MISFPWYQTVRDFFFAKCKEEEKQNVFYFVITRYTFETDPYTTI